MPRDTTLHGSFKCYCGYRVCKVTTKYLKCSSCGRIYRFSEYPDMIDRKAIQRMMMEAGHGELA